MQDFIQNYLGSLGSSLAIMGGVYFLVWYLLGNWLSKRKIQLSKRAGWAQIKGEIANTAFSLVGNTLFILVIFYFQEQGEIRLYTETGKYGMAYEIAAVLVIILVSDAWFYWAHRWMHHPKVYKYVHALHHQSLDVNPFTSNSFHIIEAVLLTLWVLPLLLLMPVSAAALGIVQAIGAINNIKSHLGYELYPSWVSKAPFNMFVTATNHSLHHTQYNGNYGLFFRFWDWVCGTELKTTIPSFVEIHNREAVEIIDNSQYKPLQIDKLVKETKDTISIYFRPTDKLFYNYWAGQYLTIRVNVKGKTHTRCFSLSSSPIIDDFLRITVRLKGEVSHHFFNDAQVGDTIEALYPVGDFYLKPEPTADKKYVMIAGGSGITPLYSMINQLIKAAPQSKIILLYANKSADNIIFKTELEHLAQTNTQFEYINFISGENRISTADLAAHQQADFFLCGPDSLKEAMISQLKTLKVDNAKINVEHYADGYVPWFGLF